MSATSFPDAGRKSDVLCGICHREILLPAEEKSRALKCHDYFHSECAQKAVKAGQLKLQPCLDCRNVTYIHTQLSLDAIKATRGMGEEGELILKRPSLKERRIYPV